VALLPEGVDEGSGKVVAELLFFVDGGRFDMKEKTERERVMVVTDGVDGEFTGGGVGTDSVGA